MQIETIDERMVAILHEKTPTQKVAVISAAHRTAAFPAPELYVRSYAA